MRQTRSDKSDFVLTKPQLEAVIQEARRFGSQRCRPEIPVLIELLATYGLRIGEAFALVGSNLDRDRMAISIEASLDRDGNRTPPKTPSSWRTVQINSGRFADLEQLAEGPSDLLFTSPEGLPIRYTNFRRRVFKPIVEKALPEVAHLVGTHTFRRSVVTNMSREGWNPKLTQGLMGHATSRLTMDVYNKFHGGFSREQAEALSLR